MCFGGKVNTTDEASASGNNTDNSLQENYTAIIMNQRKG
jgi:hypothetical protein